jgi:hypothetical protein
MKAIILLICLVPSVCLSNPFDQFTGVYTSDSSPRINNQNSASCFRYAFEKLSALEVVKTVTEGHEQTHMIIFKSFLNNSPISITHPVMEYSDQVGRTGVEFATTSGSLGFARNTMGTRSGYYTKEHIIEITQTDNGIELIMTESILAPHGNISCDYAMDFIKI